MLKEWQETRTIQEKRYEGFGVKINVELDRKLLLEFATSNTDGLALLNKVAEQLKLSMRGYKRVLRVALTIADMESAYQVNKYILQKPYIIDNYQLENHQIKNIG
ncbi:MAG: hypothetical protein AB8U25_05025 [Rickettsiales endosymbiont of Dermacentor nuttalli]